MVTAQTPLGVAAEEAASLLRSIRPFEGGSIPQSVWQIVNSFVPFVALWASMVYSLRLSYFLTLALAVPAAGFLVRIFIIQHDCGHGSFLGSPAGNRIVGRLCSLITMTPFEMWRRHHAVHHRNSNNLDRRASGRDMFSDTHTVDEYLAMSRWARFAYRLGRNPLICHLLLPPLVFLIMYRTPFDTPADWKRERRSVRATNLGLLLVYGGLGFWVGWRSLALVELPVIGLAAIVGIWLFAVQHRFERTVWLRERDWSFNAAGLAATSWLRLPRVLQWFSGNIGLHHAHHLSPRIPNYRLEECVRALPALQGGPSLSLGRALTASSYWLWDEDGSRMVRFKDLEAG